MNVDDIARATHVGELPIQNITIPCAVLEDGRRVLTQQGFLQAIGRARSAKGGQGSSVDVVPFLAAKNLQGFISPELREQLRPIRFRHALGGTAYGYSAECLPKVCEVYIRAAEAGALHGWQGKIAVQSSILLDALSTTGIIALVDEATGFQFQRARDALQEILNAYISAGLLKWTRVFPDEFYKELFRLRGLTYDEVSSKRPPIIGKDTADYIYERLAPNVLKELRRLTPRTKSGRLRHKLFQRLTEDVGHPRLREHLAAVIALMRSSDDHVDFVRRLDRAFPRYTAQQTLDFEQ